MLDEAMAQSAADSQTQPASRTSAADYGSLAFCSLIWGTTWFAITLQLGGPPAAVSVVYRFVIAAGVFFAWLALTRRKIALTRAQHLAAFGQGLFTFAIDYLFVYLAEEKVASAVVAVSFASLALTNLILFRLVLGQRGSPGAWAGAGLGVAGVAVLSAAELGGAGSRPEFLLGLAFAAIAVIAAGFGNVCAYKGQHAGADVVPATAWAMAYGAAILTVYALVTGQPWRFTPTPPYLGSLLYLALFGSVATFAVYFAMARRRGYTFASYVSALTPGVAMLVSALLEGARWGAAALAGLALVLAGQVLLVRAPRA